MDMHLSLFPRQVRGIDAAPEKLRRLLQVEKDVPDTLFQLVNARRRRVSERLLGLCPDMLVGIELWSVGGEVVQMEATAATQIQTHGFVAVDFGAVPQKHDLSSEVPQRQAKELDDAFPVDVFAVASEVHADPLPDRGDRDRGDDRHPAVPIAMAQDRCLPDRRPGLADVGGEHEAAFVEEDQVSTELTGVFLYRASRPASTWLSPLPCAPSPGAPASARSIPSVAAATVGRPSAHNAHRSASRSNPRLGAASRGPWRTPPAGRRRPATWLESLSERASAAAAVPGSASCASPVSRPADRLDSTAPLSSPTPSQPRPPLDRSRPSEVIQSLSGGVLPAALDCQEVSWPPA